MKPPVQALFRIALALAALLAGFAALDGWIRRAGLAPDLYAMPHRIFRLSTNAVLRYEHQPGTVDPPYAINAAGQRDREYPLTKPPHTVRLAVVGDSVAFGWNVAAGESWPDQLEELLNLNAGSGTVYEVINFAVAGYNLAQVVEQAQSRVRAWRPDRILYGYCLNDLQDYSMEFEVLLERLSASDRDRVRAGAPGWLYRWHTFRMIRSRWESALRPESESDDAPPNWRDDPQFQSMLRGRGADYFRGLHRGAGPAALAAGFRRLAEVAPTTVVIMPFLDDLKNYSLGDVHAQVAELATRAGLSVVDLTPVLIDVQKAGLPVASDALHPTKEGHAAVASHLAGSAEIVP